MELLWELNYFIYVNHLKRAEESYVLYLGACYYYYYCYVYTKEI